MEDLMLASELRTALTRLQKKLRGQSAIRRELSLTELAVIRQLAEHDYLLPSELARQEKVTTQSMSQILNHLAEKGYIRREPAETDRRKIRVSLSEAGQTLLRTTRHERDEWLSRALRETCTPAERQLLEQVLTPLNKLVEFE